ncbi:MAG TPA: nuclear transport factor 2 family protein [Candidatus Binatus sp.]|jgi:ketosteroid isomerase-like protein|nr:nuclear transport factor 2 family protein [Candidatus Binatus sp.]
MKRIMAALAMAALVTGMAGATDKTDVMAVVHQYTDDFNKGGTESSLALCADQATIIDDFPPYQWSGNGACAKWLSDFHAFTPQIQLTDLVVTLGKARHVYVTADRAYVVVPATVDAKEQGKPVHETGATWTFALQKGPSGWRITAWAFASGIGAVKTHSLAMPSGLINAPLSPVTMQSSPK